MALFSAIAGRAPQHAGPDSDPRRLVAQYDNPPPESATDLNAPLNGNEIALARSSDGHFYADVEINGTPVRMLVDTGASVIALTREDARNAGIATSIGMNDVIGEGADGAVHGEIIQIDRLRLGDTSAEGVGAVVLNSGGMSLLGQDFLRRFQSVEIKDDRMILR